MRNLKINCILAVLFLAVESVQADLINGGFETGDLTGWTSTVPFGASAAAVGSHTEDAGPLPNTTWAPTEGSFFALLETDGPGNWCTLEQSFSGVAGDVVSFDYFFDWGDLHPFNDQCYGELLDATGAQEHEFFRWGQDGTPMVANHSNVGWSSESYALAADGDYTLKFGIANCLDSINDSYMGIDAAVVPVPGAVLLGMLGLSVAGIKLRKFA
jgi:hypothetical protein